MNKCICILPYKGTWMSDEVLIGYARKTYRYQKMKYDYVLYFDEDQVPLPQGGYLEDILVIDLVFKKHFVDIEEYRNNQIEKII